MSSIEIGQIINARSAVSSVALAALYIYNTDFTDIIPTISADTKTVGWVANIEHTGDLYVEIKDSNFYCIGTTIPSFSWGAFSSALTIIDSMNKINVEIGSTFHFKIVGELQVYSVDNYYLGC